jgi:choline dehydrogenase-like flavoprotein
MAFHNYRASAGGVFPGFEDQYIYGRNTTNPIIANYRNLHKKDTDYLGGYLTFVWSHRSAVAFDRGSEGIGSDYKKNLTEPGPWMAGMYMQGETIPRESNHVKLSTDLKDAWGIPQLITSIDYDDNAEKMVVDFMNQSSEMLEKAGCKNIHTRDTKQAPGLDIHEMGGCRMGRDPKDSLLNEWNQLHHCKNVFVTDGACMTSTGTQSPSILYMAFAARAAHRAAEEMKKQEL